MIQMAAETGLRIVALHDRNPRRMEEAQETMVQAYAGQGIKTSPRLYANGQDLIHAPDVGLVVITSPTNTHRQYAVPALRSGKKVYCDKPLAHTVEDSIAIVEAETRWANPLIMGFTRRYEPAWKRAHALLQEGTIGDLVMLQIRDIIPYHRYLTAWWRRRAWSGGALNDKGCHLFDAFSWFVGSRANQVHGFGGRSAVEPDPEAPARCQLCDRDCPYRRRAKAPVAAPVALDLLPHYGQSWTQETEEEFMDDVCVYAPGADLYHNASLHFRYDNGVIASFFYSIFGPPAEDQETLELVGTSGRILLVRHRGTLDIVCDHGRHHEVIDCRDEHFDETLHFGADITLIRELGAFCQGEPPAVSARAGLEATRMVAAALQSLDGGGVTVEMSEIADASL
jgi:predicted dehydrogenase